MLPDERKARFIEKAQKLHGNFDYSKVEYVNSKTKVIIICPKHGEFEQTPGGHLQGRGCNGCKSEKLGRLKRPCWDKVKERIAKVHGDRYVIPDQEYINNHTKLTVICRLHGEFKIAPVKLINEGQGCRKCGILKTTADSTKDLSYFKSKLTKSHLKKYEYDFSSYTMITEKITITCKKHNNTYEQKANVHLSGNGGCKFCAAEAVSRSKKLSFKDFSIKLFKVYGDSLKPVEETYRGSKDKMTIMCSKSDGTGVVHGEFTKRPNDLLMGVGCPKCSGVGSSRGESELFEFISNNAECFKGNKKNLEALTGISERYLEIDILVPKFKLAIEFNGLYWHSEKFRPDPGHHLAKTKKLAAAGYKLVHIWEDDWKFRRGAMENRLLSMLGKGETTYARNTKIGYPTHKDATAFLDAYHTQGRGASAREAIALYSKDRIVALMTFSKCRFSSEAEWELMRFCSVGRVVGGFSKLLMNFRRQHPGESVVTYADRCWGDGRVYKANGFRFAGNSDISYWWFKGFKRYSRFNFMKHKLASKFDNFNEDLTEVENCRNNGYLRIFGCGNSKWII